jgi:hypothetical protein
MEGRVGQNILKWVYFLDNYEEVLNRADDFKDPEHLLLVHDSPGGHN